MIKLETFHDSIAAEWDDFVRTSRNGTFLHSRPFFQHNAANSLDDCSIVFRSGSRIAAVLPAILQDHAGRRVLHSHPRSTYGGLILSNELSAREVVDCVSLLVEHSKSLNVDEVVIRSPFRILHSRPSDEVDYGLWRAGFRVQSRELELAVPLETVDPNDLLTSFTAKARTSTRRAIKTGVQVKQTLDYAEFWDILETNLRERHDTRPTHTLAQFSRLRELVGEERVSLWGGYLDGRLIAGVVLFIPNKQATHAQYIASRAEFSRFCALNAVLSQIIKWSAENRFKYFNLGMATENAGRDMNEGLIHFKEGFGARGVLRETMALTLKPAAPVEQATRPARLP